MERITSESYERDGYEIDVHVNYNIVDREMYGTYNIKKSYERDDFERVGYERDDFERVGYERDGYEIDVHVNYNIVDREMLCCF